MGRLLRSMFLFVTAFAAESQAQVASEPPDLGLKDPAVQLSLSALPPIKDDHVRGAVVSYDKAAKAWWIQLHCHLATDEEAKRFPTELADFTNAMRGIFRREFQASPDEAGKYAETVQMYAMEAMSAAKFFGCGETAKALLRKGLDETDRFSAFLNSVKPKSQ